MNVVPVTAKLAIAIFALLSFGSLLTAPELLLHFLRPFPAIQHLHAASVLGKTIWLSAGVFGGVSILCLVRGWLTSGVVAALAFVATYIFGAISVWSYFTFGCWLAILAAVLTLFVALRANYSLKRTAANRFGVG